MSDVTQVREAARERWGDAWTLVRKEWADGDSQVRAIHSLGRTADGDRLKREELTVGDTGEVVVETVLLQRERTVVAVERDP
jgi:hypothetical protein